MRRFNSTLILGLFILILASPLTAMAAPTRKDMVIDFSIQCIDITGGAVLNPGATGPTISNTFAITNVIDTLDVWLEVDILLIDQIIIGNVSDWVAALQVTSPIDDPGYGGILPYPNAPNATLMASYYASQTLDLLNKTGGIDSSLLYDFVLNLQRINATEYPDTVGGFSDLENGTVTVAATYFAIQALEPYNQISLINQTLAIPWLNSSQFLGSPSSPSHGGFVNGRNSSTPDLQTTFMAIHSLEILGSLSVINQTAAMNYILQHYRTDTNYPQHYGGFSLTPDNPIATLWATYYAVATLQILGWTGDTVIVNEITDWILSTQSTDGGFIESPGQSGFAPQTNLAISTLALLNQLQRLQEPLGVDPFIFPWWIVGIIAIIIIIILFVICARRADWF